MLWDSFRENLFVEIDRNSLVRQRCSAGGRGGHGERRAERVREGFQYLCAIRS